MTVRLNHLAIPSRDAEAAAKFLSDVLDLPVRRDGPEGEFPCLVVANGVQILFQQSTDGAPHHVAFEVTVEAFQGVVERLRRADVAFGNDPEAVANGEVTDFLGGSGRVYFRDPDGHLFEVCA